MEPQIQITELREAPRKVTLLTKNPWLRKLCPLSQALLPHGKKANFRVEIFQIFQKFWSIPAKLSGVDQTTWRSFRVWAWVTFIYTETFSKSSEFPRRPTAQQDSPCCCVCCLSSHGVKSCKTTENFWKLREKLLSWLCVGQKDLQGLAECSGYCYSIVTKVSETSNFPNWDLVHVSRDFTKNVSRFLMER